MTLKKLLMIGFVAALLVACGDDDSDFATRPSGDSSSSSVTPQSSEGETSVSSSSAKSSSSSKDVILSSSEGSSPSSSSSEQAEGTLTDSRDGQTYKTVTIGTQTWMAENLNYAYTSVPYNYEGSTSDSTSWCYNDSAEYCAKYGRFYTWAAAMDSVGAWSKNGKGCGYGTTCFPTYPVRGVCPEGWHLPKQTEWRTLYTAVGGLMLKSTSGWYSSGNGTDAYAFSVLPAGGRYDDGNYLSEGDGAYFWSSTDGNSGRAYNVELFYNGDGVYPDNFDKNYGFSVRCVKDD